MQYILTTGWDDGVADLTERLSRELGSGQRVLWLVSGGSNVEPSVQIMANISNKLSRGLGIMLADERYGPPGHIDSNWAQLIKAGFKTRNARVIEILQDGLDFEQTLARYNTVTDDTFKNYDLIILQMGVGRDGHVAGILPGSVAAFETKNLAAGYPDPPLKRLTLTFPAIRKVHEAYVFAFGAPKHETLALLQSQSLSPEVQPVQILKELPEAYLYSDQLDENE